MLYIGVACAPRDIYDSSVSGGAERTAQNIAAEQNAKLAAGGIYKIGTPYKIENQWYYPQENKRYDMTGVGSWYGPKFHGKRTANGEIFDMNLLTAAHPTLPMPIWARVTNLENNKSVIVRINDRGPFKKNREIDLSRRAAQILGYLEQGTAQLRVQYLGYAPRYDATGKQIFAGDKITPTQTSAGIAKKPHTPPEQAYVNAAPIDAVIESALESPVRVDIPSDFGTDIDPSQQTPIDNSLARNVPAPLYAIQIGVYSDHNVAQRIVRDISHISKAEISEINNNQKQFFRVRVGHTHMTETIYRTLSQIVDLGYKDAMVVSLQR